ncbi:MAG: glycosyltransferase 87 family protein [Eubacteriales bacterium]|nr:glycosyltransferase 87 family protein [Eubacteriales bacterium]
MMKWEERLREWISSHVLWFGYGAVALLGLFLRWSYLPHLAADLEFMNSSWFNAIKQGGMAAVLDPELQYTYSPLHLYLWTLAAGLLGSLDTPMALKLISLGFDALLVCACTVLLRLLLPKEKKAFYGFIGFALLWLSPILLWNSAAWGQTDAYFALFSVLAVVLLLKDRPEWSLIALGVALSWKLQAIFLLPLFGIAYFCGKKKFSLLWFLTVPGILILSGVPMMLVGESPLFALQIYLGQTGMYSEITYNCPNLYAVMGEAIQNKQAVLGMFSRTGIVLAVSALGLMAVWLIGQKAEVSGANAVLLGAWCVLCCVFFLPRMHERYGVVGELLLLCWAVSVNRPRAYLYVLLELLATLSAYSQYLFRYPFFSLQTGGVLMLVVLCLLSWETIKAFQPKTAPAAI